MWVACNKVCLGGLLVLLGAFLDSLGLMMIWFSSVADYCGLIGGGLWL